jgi:hypothetical protein
LKALMIGGLALFWIITGVVALFPAREEGIVLLTQAGLHQYVVAGVIAGSLVDITIGIGIAIKRTVRIALWSSVLVSLFYLALGGVLLPELWIDPLGPLVKIPPVLIASFATLAILDDR